jgi:hypothetical protein
MTQLNEVQTGIAPQELAALDLKPWYDPVVEGIFSEETFAGENERAEQIFSGLIHRVYRIKSPDETMYLKIRGSRFAMLPDIPTDPSDIAYEKKIMEIFSGLLPNMFPRIVRYYENEHAILMTDIMPSGITLEGLLNKDAVSESVLRNCGRAVSDFHTAVSAEKPIRPDGDELVYNNNLLYRLGYMNIPALNAAVEELGSMPRQLIHADLSPKNIGAEEDNVAFCDLEIAHAGNPIFDVAFLAAHLLLHSKDPVQGAKRLDAFLEGYYDDPAEALQSEKLLKTVILGIAAYRLDNPVIPYNLPLTTEVRKQRAEAIAHLLERSDYSWSELIGVVTSDA